MRPTPLLLALAAALAACAGPATEQLDGALDGGWKSDSGALDGATDDGDDGASDGDAGAGGDTIWEAAVRGEGFDEYGALMLTFHRHDGHTFAITGPQMPPTDTSVGFHLTLEEANDLIEAIPASDDEPTRTGVQMCDKRGTCSPERRGPDYDPAGRDPVFMLFTGHSAPGDFDVLAELFDRYMP